MALGLHIYSCSHDPPAFLSSRAHNFPLACMAKAENPSRVDENAVTVLEKDWTREEEKKARLK